jgi:DNA-binding transcriptional regulator YbjK
MAVATRRAPRGPTDPDRRERIAAAALEVALERGVPAVSHRTVAAAAGVPLGSTTYHFAGLDELLAAAMRLAADRYGLELDAWSRGLDEDADIAAALADAVVAELRSDRGLVIAEYELYLVSLRRPALQAVTRDWARRMTDVLERHTDPATAYALSVASDGALLAALVTGETPRRETLADLFGRILAGAPPSLPA